MKLQNLQVNILYTRKQPLMMAYERSQRAWDNFCKFNYKFQTKTKTHYRKLERIFIKYYEEMCLHYFIKNA